MLRLHTIPINDELIHEPTMLCSCGPAECARLTDAVIIGHNAEDGREAVERLLGEPLSPDHSWLTVREQDCPMAEAWECECGNTESWLPRCLSCGREAPAEAL